MKKLLVGSMVCILFGWSGSCQTYSTERGFFYDYFEEKIVRYEIPDEYRVGKPNLIFGHHSQVMVSVPFDSLPPSLNDDFSSLEVYFASENDTTWSLGIILPLGKLDYASDSLIRRGEAYLVDLRRNEILMPVSYRYDGNKIVFELGNDRFKQYRDLLAVVRYLPRNFDLKAVSGGFQACVVGTSRSENTLSPNFKSRIPLWMYRYDPSVNRQQQRQQQPSGFELPPTFVKVIPINDDAPPVGKHPKPCDYDGDGRNDWQLGDFEQLEPGSPIYIGVGVIDKGDLGASRGLIGGGDEYIALVGEDRNGNGKIECHEIRFPIGQCPLPRGDNSGWISKSPGGCYVSHWTSEQTPKKAHFIYNFCTGKLTVVCHGEIIYEGPPNGYPWHDPNRRCD